MLDLVVLGETDRLVEAAAPGGRGGHVPQPDAPFCQSRQPGVVRETVQRFADRASEQAPELIGRMRVILARRERGVAGQAAEHEQPRVGAGDRRQSGFDAHPETPTSPRCNRATSGSPSSRAITIMSATGPTKASTGWSVT